MKRPYETLQYQIYTWKETYSIAYHRVHESVAANILRIGYVPSSDNLADMLTKPLTREKIHDFCEQILY